MNCIIVLTKKRADDADTEARQIANYAAEYGCNADETGHKVADVYSDLFQNNVADEGSIILTKQQIDDALTRTREMANCAFENGCNADEACHAVVDVFCDLLLPKTKV